MQSTEQDARFFLNPEGVKCLNQVICRDIQVLRTWKTVFVTPVGCTYGYSHSIPLGLQKCALLI